MSDMRTDESTACNVHELVLAAMRAPYCSVIAGAASHAETESSIVVSMPSLALDSLRTVCEPRNISCNLVRIEAVAGEPLHFHSSFIACVVVEGGGAILDYRKGRITGQCVGPGDLIVIPRGVSHVFKANADMPMVCIGFEFSDGQIDYQACFFEV